MHTTDKEIYRCRARGRFKLGNTGLIVGDRVEFNSLTSDEGVLEHIEPRQTFLVRPPVANVDQVVIVCALQNPPLSLQLLDRLLVLSADSRLGALICFNKDDLPHEDLTSLKDIYTQAGYLVFLTSAKYALGIEPLQAALCRHISVFAGPSGAGKSSLINQIQPGLSLRVGDISHKNKRGKHTTRHVELLTLDCGGYVADTPGFSQLDLNTVASDELRNCFPEFVKLSHGCRFNTCKHQEEPDCAVKAAVASGLLAASRYENYLFFLQEIRQKERSY